VTEISITADRREQVRLFILMAASFTCPLLFTHADLCKKIKLTLKKMIPKSNKC
jgi:hypothetical protein